MKTFFVNVIIRGDPACFLCRFRVPGICNNFSAPSGIIRLFQQVVGGFDRLVGDHLQFRQTLGVTKKEYLFLGSGQLRELATFVAAWLLQSTVAINYGANCNLSQ